MSWLIAGGATILHLVTVNGYGIFRDELYYLACAEHLDWGYVDHPPLVAVIGWMVRNLLGTSLLALRFVPAVAAGFHVLLAACIARELGGTRFAQALTAVAVAVAPVYLSIFSIFSMNAFDLVIWAALILLAARLLASADTRLWLLFGPLAGIGLMNKLSVLFLLAGLGVGFVIGRKWSLCFNRSFWLGASLALLLFLPHVLWQVANGFPTGEFIRNAAESKNLSYAPLEFMVEQILMMNPVSLPLWIAGLAALIFSRRLRRFRAIGWVYIPIFILMTTQGGKPYYLSPAYPLLFAGGAVWFGEWIRSRGWRAVRTITFAVLILSGIGLMPLSKPVLPVDTYVRYASELGVHPGTSERHEMGRLPQFFADMHGWKELAEEVARVFHELPEEDRHRACIYAQNYGQAGAIDLFGPSLGLPHAISGHNSYWLWGPGDCTGEVVLIIGGRKEDHLMAFAQVEPAGEYSCRDCMPYEARKTLWVARDVILPIGEVWARTRHYN